MLPWLVAAALALVPGGTAGDLVLHVIDALGAPVPGAHVLVAAGTAVQEGQSAPDGTFRASTGTADEAVVTVSAPGFAPVERRVRLPRATVLRVVLEPSRVETTIVVTATRDSSDVGVPRAGTSVLAAPDLATASGFGLDDALKATPGFTLFRRSTSRVANPTTHGVTLRGLTASGASRTLVLGDGVPLNDPFGGWVSWNRIPQAAIDRVEVVRGGAGDLYGPDALGGVVQVFTGLPRAAVLRGVFDVAGQRTARGSVGGALRVGWWQTLVAAEVATSEGYIPVAPEDRGPIDEPAGGSYRTLVGRTGGQHAAWNWQLGGSAFVEDRQNGTPLQRNATVARQGLARVAWPSLGGYWRLDGFAGSQAYDQTFSAVAPGRGSEALTVEQRVPSEVNGQSADWGFGSRTHVLVGIERREVRATNQETRFPGGAALRTDSGGRQSFVGGYAQAATFLHPSLSLLFAFRAERWSVTPLGGTHTSRDWLFAPRVAAAWQASDAVSVRGSVSRAFRAPTLNERFRGFRVGDTVTQPNPDLAPERLTALEGGVTVDTPLATFRATAFANRLADAIANVTVSATPALVVRERRNAGRVLADGLELEADSRVGRRLHVTLAAALTHSRFGEGAPEGLEGRRVPQSARVQLSGELEWADLPGIGLSARVYVVGDQYEDDRNTLRLRPSAVTDVQLTRQLARSVLVIVAIENLLDVEMDVGRTPLRTIGSPRLFRAGCRVILP